jgi:hypothetical protein
MERELVIGDHLIFIDADRQERNALLIAIHGEPKGRMSQRYKWDGKGKAVLDDDGNMVPDGKPYLSWPCINLCIVDKNEGATDQYGRQTVKDGITSVVHWEGSTANGFCWRFLDEEVTTNPEPTIR